MFSKGIIYITRLGCSAAFREAENKHIILSNIMNIVLALAMVGWIILALICYPAFNYNLDVFLFTITTCAVSFYLNYSGYFLFSKVFVLLTYDLAMSVHLILLGATYGHQFLFIPATAISFFLFKRNEGILKYSLFLLNAILFFYFELLYSNNRAIVTLQQPYSEVMQIATHITIFGSITLITLYASLYTNRVEMSLEFEHQRSEDLLFNILPRSIAGRLIEDHKNIADSFENVSVLFADIVGFTSMTSKISPESLVSMLNNIFSKLDDLAQQYGLEKIKTIGDCYMVASGLPEKNADHAIHITNFALDMLDVMTIMNIGKDEPIILRIGINSGPVVAGVIGKKKFIYDLWGDTVNVASRMEANGIAGQIQITEATFNLVSDHFEIIKRGEINIKGKGMLPTYMVSGRK